MKRLSILSLLCLFVSISLWAQKNEGFFNLTQLSFLIAEENTSSPLRSNMAPSVVNISGYRFNEYASLGVGVGMTALSYVIVPVFADLRIALFKGSLSPVVAIKGGYSFAKSKKEIFPNEYYNVDYKNRGGGMFNPEIGIKMAMNDRADFMLTFGYWYQHVKSEMKDNTYNPGYNRTHNRTSDLNRLSFSISFLFK